MSRKEKESQGLARRLLNSAVRLPTYPETEEETIGEEEVRLGDQIPDELAAFLLGTEMPTDAATSLPEIIHKFKVLGKAVVKLSTTGAADRAILQQGEALLEGLIPLVKKEAEEVRTRLSPDHKMIRSFRKSSGDDGASEVLEIVYFQYLGMSCAAETLEAFLAGLRDINAALAKQPGLSPGP